RWLFKSLLPRNFFWGRRRGGVEVVFSNRDESASLEIAGYYTRTFAICYHFYLVLTDSHFRRHLTAAPDLAHRGPVHETFSSGHTANFQSPKLGFWRWRRRL